MYSAFCTIGRNLEFLLELSNDSVLVLDEAGVILAANAEAERMFGRSRTELVSLTFRALRTPKGIRPLPYETRPDSLIYEVWLFRKDGTTFLADASVSTVTDDGRKFFVSVLRDMTPREESQRQQRLVTAVFENSLQGIMITDSQSRVIAVNPAFEHITGCPAAEVIGSLPNLFEDSSGQTVFRGTLPGAASDSGRWQGEIRGRRRNGEAYSAWLSVSAVHDESGEMVHQVSVFSDISELRRAGEQLRRLTSLYSALSEINQLIARHPGENELFASACRIAVDHGQFRLAWIGVVDGNTQRVVPVAMYGRGSERVLQMDISVDPDLPGGCSVMTLAIRSASAVVINDCSGDPCRQCWHGSIGSEGLKAAASFPVRRGGAVIGALGVYAAEKDFFSDDLTMLLSRMAADISFALDGIDQEVRRRSAEARIVYLARHDTLTGLHRRTVLEEALVHRHAEAQRLGSCYSIALIDIDHFKVINDSYGHAVGDEVLKQVSAALLAKCRAMDWIGRWGGEEFLCLLPDTDSDLALHSMERLREDISADLFPAGERSLRVTVSVGVASFPHDGASVSDLLVKADTALYSAKKAGGDRVAQGGHKPGIFLIGGQVEEALSDGRIVPVYQPVVSLATGEIVADEALARLKSVDGEFLDAAHFIEAAGHLHQVYRIDQRIIGQVMACCLARIRAGERPRLHFVNASAELLAHPERVEGLLGQIRELFHDDGLLQTCAGSMVVEITERAILEDRKSALKNLRQLVECGFRVALDDFGSGYSSFLYLAEFPVSFLKLEQRFVKRVTRDGRTASMVRGIASMARDLGLTTIAEGIEDADAAALLQQLGVDWGQGYQFGRPVIECW